VAVDEKLARLLAPLDELVRQAKAGNPQAVKLYLEALGLLPRGRVTTVVNKLTFFHPTRGRGKRRRKGG